MSYDGHKVLRAKVCSKLNLLILMEIMILVIKTMMMRMAMIIWFKVEDEAQASALHQLSEVGIYDFWTEVSKIIWEHK